MSQTNRTENQNNLRIGFFVNCQFGEDGKIQYTPSVFGAFYMPTLPQTTQQIIEYFVKISQNFKQTEAKQEEYAKGLKSHKKKKEKNKINVNLPQFQQKKDSSVLGTKAKRPQTYETEKSFYMKQKLKGKNRDNFRILRKRNTENQSSMIKSKLRTLKGKKSYDQKKKLKKKHETLKEDQKTKRIFKKPKQKMILDSSDGLAKVPPVILGVFQLNQFIRQKLQSLTFRNIHRK